MGGGGLPGGAQGGGPPHGTRRRMPHRPPKDQAWQVRIFLKIRCLELPRTFELLDF